MNFNDVLEYIRVGGGFTERQVIALEAIFSDLYTKTEDFEARIDTLESAP